MKKNTFHLFLCLILLSVGSFLQAQNSEKNTLPLFVDAEFGGAWIHDYFNNTMYTLSGGYLLRPSHGIGLEMRSIKGTSGQNISMQGLGLNYRFSRKRFISKLSVGKVLDVSYTSSEGYLWRYSRPQGGHYLTHTVGMRVVHNFMLGLNCTVTRNVNYRYSYGQYIYDDHGNFAVFYHPSESRRISFLTLSLVAGINLN